MKKRHVYDYKVTPSHAATKVAQMVGVDKSVLELGSGPGSMTRLFAENRCRVTALELDPDAIRIVAQYCERVVPCDLNNHNWHSVLFEQDKYDVIVAGDVLEHLNNPWSMLESLHGLLEEDGYVVVSLPHLAHNAVIACLLNGDFEYQSCGMLDRTHIRFFAMQNIQRLFTDAGFKIVEVDFVVRSPEQTEFARQWRKLSAETREALKCNKFGTVYQVVIKAKSKSKSSSAVGIDILSQVVPKPLRNLPGYGLRENRIVRFLISCLSLGARKRLSELIDNLGFWH